MKKDFPQPPSTVIPDSIEVQGFVTSTAANGVKVHVIDCSRSNVVRMSFIFRAGTSWQSVPFCASATVNTLSEGSQNLTSLEIAEKLDFYGSYFDVSVDRDYSVVTFCCLSKFFDATMKVAEEILLKPLFPENEVAIYCSKRHQTLDVERSKTNFVAREEFASALFGAAHPYGISSPSSSYDDLRREHLAEFYNRHYTASNCFVVVSGDVSQAQSQAVCLLAGMLPQGESLPERVFPNTASTTFRQVPFKGAVQSSIRIGRLLFPRSHPDFIPMQVLTTLLGGYFGSRLVQNLRERHGYTYGAYAAMVNFDLAGYMAIATDVALQSTDDAIREIFVEMERLQNERVGEHELDMVRNMMLGEVMRVLDGPFGIADVTIENIQNSLDNNYTSALVERVKSVTSNELMSLAQRYLTKESFTTVIVG